MEYCGLFVGLTTLDLIYGVSHVPAANEKQVANVLEIVAGGPATNAAVTFRHLGNKAVLLSAVGRHPVSGLIRDDLKSQQVELIDLLAERSSPPPISSIMVAQDSGDRSVVSRNALNLQIPVNVILANTLDINYLEKVDILLVDGHQIEISIALAQAAWQRKIPVVLDGGSWKTGLEKLLPWVDYAICSADFFVPSCTNVAQTIEYLSQKVGTSNITKSISPAIVVTNGNQPIRYSYQKQIKEIEIPIVYPIDTLGAGDIFHGAFCNAILKRYFLEAVEESISIAAMSCESFGTRQWLNKLSRAEINY
jgi:sugar/nucleoside kinase (ribokinase family)